MASPIAFTALDVICIMSVVLGGSMMLATGAGIALFNETKISDRARRIDGFVTSGILTLAARFFEGWPKANGQLKAIFTASFVLCLIAIITWIGSHWVE